MGALSFGLRGAGPRAWAARLTGSKIEDKNVAFPLSRRKPHGGVQRVFGRMRPAIHPDRPLGSPSEMVRADRDEFLRRRIALLPNAHARKTRHVVRRVNTALILRKRDQRCVPTVGPKPRRIVDRHASVVAKFRTEQTVRPVLVQHSKILPDSGQIHLAKSRPDHPCGDQ